MKDACAYVGGPTPGTGYVVAPQRLATCHHVVKDWVEGERQLIWIGPAAVQHEAWLMKCDPATDCAILAFDGASPGALPLAQSLQRKAVWEGYGYPALANQRRPSSGSRAAGLPLDGEILDPHSTDDAGRPALVLYSRMVAAGQASPLHGFSGSPVLVDGAVVGHLTKFVGDSDDRKRAAYGFLFACPVAALRDLLDVPHTAVPVSGESIAVLADYIPTIPGPDHHVFVSCRTSDRLWAMSLVARLEGAGYDVVIDERELALAEGSSDHTSDALARSHSAIVVVSRDWLAAPWHEAETRSLLQRAAQSTSFQLVLVRLDDSDVPSRLGDHACFDFRDSPRAEGPEVDRLLYALIGRTPPPADTPSGRVDTREARTVDAFVAQIRAAAPTDPARVLSAVDEWRQVGLSNSTPLVVAAEVLIQQGRPELALDIVKDGSGGIRARQLRALALAKTDGTAEAIQLLEQLRLEGALDAETGGLLAGRYKERWRRARDAAAREAACELYRVTYERTGDPFNGINAASMALQCGDPASARRLATQVREAVETLPPKDRDHWQLATLAEAYLIDGKVNEARSFYRKAVARAVALYENIAVMRRQARLDLEALGEKGDALDDVLPVPSVVVFAGHLTDAPGRQTPRFPEAKVSAVRRAIRQKLQQLRNPQGFGSAARGADMIFIEELLRAGGRASVILPFATADFLAVSGGPGWNERFQKFAERIELVVLPNKRPPDAELGAVFAQANREIQRRALEYAARLDETAVVMAVWNRQPGDGIGGTADTIRLWREEGVTPDIIDISLLPEVQ